MASTDSTPNGIKTIQPSNEFERCIYCDLSQEDHLELTIHGENTDPKSFLICRDNPVTFREFCDCANCGDALQHIEFTCPKAVQP